MAIGWTAAAKRSEKLGHAAGGGRGAEVEQMLSEGGLSRAAKVEALMIAAFAGKTDCARLLARACGPQARGKDGRTALMAAAFGGSLETVEAMLAAGCDPMARDSEGWTALSKAAASKGSEHEEIAARLAPLSDVGAKGPYGFTAAMHAACSGHARALRAIVAEHAKDPPKRASWARMLAKELMARGRPWGEGLDARDSNGKAALHHAAQMGNQACVEALLAGGADPKAADSFGRTPLMAAAWAKSSPCVELLLPGSDATARDQEGASAQSLAAERGCPDIAQMAAAMDRSAREAIEIREAAGASQAPRRPGLRI